MTLHAIIFYRISSVLSLNPETYVDQICAVIFLLLHYITFKLKNKKISQIPCKL